MSLHRILFQRTPLRLIWTELNGQTNNASLILRKFSSSTEPSQWDLYASLCLQRPPILGQELNWLERRMHELFNRVEIADSLYSDHEMRHFEDIRRTERIASGLNVDEKDLEEAAKQTAQDFVESSLEEWNKFKVGSTVTKADLINNIKSIDRSLDKYLFLSVNVKIEPDQSLWLFPQELHQTGESLRKTAERALVKYFPNQQSKDSNVEDKPSINVKFLGNTPAAYYSYYYPKSLQSKDGKLGARVFLFKCDLDRNNSDHPATEGTFGDRILAPKSAPDYAWFTRTELEERLPERYWKSFGKAIYPDELINIEHLLADKRRKAYKLSNQLKKLEATN